MLSITGPETTWSRFSGRAEMDREGEAARRGKDGDVAYLPLADQQDKNAESRANSRVRRVHGYGALIEHAGHGRIMGLYHSPAPHGVWR